MIVQLIHFRMKAFERRFRLGAFAHGHPGRNDIVIVDDFPVLMPNRSGKLAEPNLRTL